MLNVNKRNKSNKTFPNFMSGTLKEYKDNIKDYNRPLLLYMSGNDFLSR